MLSRYLPAGRFQFELINPALNTERYDAADPFAPAHYTMDYLFAQVMLSNPLFWMELQYLPADRRVELARILPVWREHRERLAECDVCPILACPSGRSLTGFSVLRNGVPEYLLLFREVTEQETVELPLPADSSAQLLASNGPVMLTPTECGIRVRIGQERGYAFLQISTD